jgi:hypothetical protein
MKTITTKEGDLKLITDNRFKPFKYGNEVPKKVLKDQFDHLEDGEDQDGFFKYRGNWYHTSDFMVASDKMQKATGFDGINTDSIFSAILIKISEDCEEYKVGLIMS